MAKPLTPITVKNVRPQSKRQEIPDPGSVGLYLVVQTSGHKSFALRYRDRNSGKTVKLTLGRALIDADAQSPTDPQIGTALSLKAARALATKTLHEIAAGDDPRDEKRQRREREHAAAADSLEAVCKEHLRREAAHNLRTLDSQRRPDFELFYSELGAKPIDQIKRGEFVRCLDKISDERGPGRASRAFGNMRTLLNWHANRSEYISVLNRVKWRASGPAGGRDRVLDDAEITLIWLAAEQDDTPFAAFIRFTLLTAARRNESSGLRRSELIDNGRSWLIPSHRYKSKRDTLIPLSVKAQEIIASQPVKPRGDFVFSVTGLRAINDFAKSKIRFDKLCGVSNWRLHDLRRTARTLLSKCPGVTPDHAERCLGHAILGVRKVYDKGEYEPQKRFAFEALAALVEHIVHPPAAVVVQMPNAKKGH